MNDNLSVLERLAADFPKGEVRQRDGGRGIKLDYIDVVQTINRLTDTLDADWDWVVTDSDLSVVEADGPKYMARVQGQIRVWLPELAAERRGEACITRGGVGADIDPRDPDKAIKTADAEALKKAGHKFGIALYLWDEAKRNEIAEFRKLSNASLPQLKKAALVKSGVSDPKELIYAVNQAVGRSLDVEDLQKPEVLLEYLAA